MSLIRLSLPEEAGQTGISFEVYAVSNNELLATGAASEYVAGGFESNFPSLDGEYYTVHVLEGSVLQGIYLWHDETPVTEEDAIYKGVWDAATNTPAVPDLYEGSVGDFYFVSAAGSTTLGVVFAVKNTDSLKFCHFKVL